MAERNTWFKSTKSGPNCDNSVYVQFTNEGVETSKDPNGQGQVQKWTNADWEAFILGAKDGQFDLPA